MKQYIVLVGNIFDGSYVVGPFDDHEDAIEWGERNVDGDWLVAELYDPSSDAHPKE